METQIEDLRKNISKNQNKRIKQVQEFILPMRKKIIELDGYCNTEQLIGEVCAELSLSEEDYHLLCYWSLTELD